MFAVFLVKTIVRLLLASFAVSATHVNSQPPPMPEHDYSVELEITEPADCNSLSMPPEAKIRAKDGARLGDLISLYKWEEAIRCKTYNKGGALRFDESKARCFESGGLQRSIDPYILTCLFRFDTNANTVTTNHSVTCEDSDQVEPSQAEAFALQVARTVRWLPEVKNGVLQLEKGQQMKMIFTCH